MTLAAYYFPKIQSNFYGRSLEDITILTDSKYWVDSMYSFPTTPSWIERYQMLLLRQIYCGNVHRKKAKTCFDGML